MFSSPFSNKCINIAHLTGKITPLQKPTRKQDSMQFGTQIFKKYQLSNSCEFPPKVNMDISIFVKCKMRNRLNLLVLPSTGRQAQHFYPKYLRFFKKLSCIMIIIYIKHYICDEITF